MSRQRGSLRLEKQGWILRLRNGERRETRVVVGSRRDFPNRAQARMAADRRLAELNAQGAVVGRSLTVAELASIYETDQIPLMKPSAAYSARSIMTKHVVGLLGPRMLEELTSRVLQQFTNALHARRLSRKTIKNVFAVLSRMLILARTYDHPAARIDRGTVKLPPEALEVEQRHYTPEEVGHIIAGADYPWRACYAILGYLGLRSAEVLALTWKHLHIDAAEPDGWYLEIRQSAVYGRIQTVKSRNSKADLPIPPPLHAILCEYYASWTPNPQGLLFATAEGEPWPSRQVRERFFYPLLERLDIRKGGLHAFRHGFTTRLFSAGASAPVVKNSVRHGDIRTTMKYVHQVGLEHRLAIAKAADLVPTAR